MVLKHFLLLAFYWPLWLSIEAFHGPSPFLRRQARQHWSRPSLTRVFEQQQQCPEVIPVDYTGTIGDDNLPIFRLDILPNYQLNPTDRGKALQEWIDSNDITDLWVISHGWLTPPEKAFCNNYYPLFQCMQDICPDFHGRRPGVVGVTWNSISLKSAQAMEQLLFGEAGDHVPDDDAVASLTQELQEGTSPEEFASIEESIEESMQSLRANPVEATSDDYDDDEEESDEYEQGPMLQSIQNFGQYRLMHVMKGRAAQAGRRVLATILNGLDTDKTTTHVVGHSFGALLVSSAVSHSNADVASLTLLQGAFNKNSFARDVPKWNRPGVFRNVVNRVRGKIAVTHTSKDRELCLLYRAAANVAYRFPGGRGQWYGVEVPNVPALYQEEMAMPLVGDVVDAIGGKLRRTSEAVRDWMEIGSGNALGDDGAGGLEPHEVKTWSSLADYKLLDDKKAQKFHNLQAASGEIGGHTDVWNEHVAKLLLKTAGYMD